MIKRPCKEIKINTNHDFELTYGSFNKNNPKTIYIIGKTYIKPINEDFLHILNKMIKQINNIKFDNNHFSNKKIISVDISKERMLLNKKSLLSFEIHLLQNEIKSLDNNDLINNINSITSHFINIIKTNCENFFEITKKK